MITVKFTDEEFKCLCAFFVDGRLNYSEKVYNTMVERIKYIHMYNELNGTKPDADRVWAALKGVVG